MAWGGWGVGSQAPSSQRGGGLKGLEGLEFAGFTGFIGFTECIGFREFIGFVGLKEVSACLGAGARRGVPDVPTAARAGSSGDAAVPRVRN